MAAWPPPYPTVFPPIKSELNPNAPPNTGMLFYLAPPPNKGNFIVEMRRDDLRLLMLMSPGDMKKFALQMIEAADMVQGRKIV
jgi:hypothetical protein